MTSGIRSSMARRGRPTSGFPTRGANHLRRSPSSTASSIWFTSAIHRTTSGTRHSTGRRGRPTSRFRPEEQGNAGSGFGRRSPAHGASGRQLEQSVALDIRWHVMDAERANPRPEEQGRAGAGIRRHRASSRSPRRQFERSVEVAVRRGQLVAQHPGCRGEEQSVSRARRLAGGVHMVHLGDSSNNLWHSRLDFGADKTSRLKSSTRFAMPPASFTNSHVRTGTGSSPLTMDEIQEGKEDNYEKRNGEAEDSGLYDYDSVMHYSPFSFAKGATPVMTQGIATSGFTGSFANTGNAAGLSAGDIETLFALYPAWSANVRIPDQGSRATPALAEFAGLLHCVPHREKLKRFVAFHVQRHRLEPQHQDSRPEEQISGGARGVQRPAPYGASRRQLE